MFLQPPTAVGPKEGLSVLRPSDRNLDLVLFRLGSPNLVGPKRGSPSAPWSSTTCSIGEVVAPLRLHLLGLVVGVTTNLKDSLRYV